MKARLWALANQKNRDAFVESWLKSLPQGSSVLDAGAGFQRYKEKASHLKYLSQDFGDYDGGEKFGQKNIGKWNSKACDIISDITQIPVEDRSFDFILCTEVFEHLPEPQLALYEFTRILKPGGKLLVTAPFRCLYHQDPYFFYSGFSRYWYSYFCDKAGLQIEFLEKNGTYYSDLAQEVSRIPSFTNQPFKLINQIVSAGYLLYLYALEKIFNIKSPESCWGYHLIAKKNNQLE